jgi:sodium/bile acid cotransporter 7
MARGNVAAAVCSASFSNLIGIVHSPTGDPDDAREWFIRHLLERGTDDHAAAASPFVVGHLLRPLIGSFVARHKVMVTTVDRGSILLVVHTAFGAAVLEGLWHLVSSLDLLIIAGACCLQLSAVLVITWTIGRVLGFAREDRIVLLFCGSKKSLASGVPMAGSCFLRAALV